MHFIDFTIVIIYLIVVFLVGVYFYTKNKDRDDYYVGGRNIKPFHVGLSVVATDVGGGFSIGLGGLGYVMGLSGSWLLFTGLIGAWLTAVLIIPKIKKIEETEKLLTYPDLLRSRFNGKVAMLAGLVSAIGYMGFTGGQILAGATLAEGTLFKDIPIDLDPKLFSLIIISGIILIYTVLGGLKAVIYTDTIQWIILMGGLIFLAIPFTLYDLGGFEEMRKALPAEFFRFDNVDGVTIINWFVTILPIWFIAMTLYQRVYACAGEKEAKKAWYIAGVFEYPIMAFSGVFLGMASRIYFPEVQAEMGLPMLLKEILPIGLQGLIVAAYFSAVMSTADSCLIASSGNFVNDVIEKLLPKKISDKQMMKLSQFVTFIVGAIAFIIASFYDEVLEVILHAYSFMVSALLIPTLAVYFSKRPNSNAALMSMLTGGILTLTLIFTDCKMPFGLDPSFWGITISLITYLFVNLFKGKENGDH